MPDKIYIGNNEVSKVYLGVTILYGVDGTPNGNFSFEVPEGGASTSAGVYQVIDGDDVLVRTLWSGKPLAQGIQTAHWDGLLDDAETVVPYDGYKIKVLTSQASYEWEGGHVGNSGPAITGYEVLRAGETIRGLAHYGNYLYVAGSNNEAVTPRIRFEPATAPTKAHYMEEFSAHEQALDQVCVDNDTVYWGGYWISPDVNFFTGITANKFDDSDVIFNAGVSHQSPNRFSRMYPSVIGMKNTVNSTNDAGLITGLAVQKNGNYLFATRGRIDNELIVIDKRPSHGEVVQTYTNLNHATWICTDPSGNLWVRVDGNIIKKFTVNPSTGALTEVMSFNVEANTAKNIGCIKVSPNGAKLAVCHLHDQVVKFYNTSTGAYINSLGDGTSYEVDASVNNYKYFWKDINTTYQAYLCYLDDGTLYVGDPQNRRFLRYDTNNVFINAVYVPTMNYYCMALPNAPQRVFSENMEFEIDYNVPLTHNSGWTLKKNWSANILWSKYNGTVQNITQFPNGKTYGTVRGFNENNLNKHVIEFVEGGAARDTGIILESLRQFFIVSGDKIFNPEGAAIGIQSTFIRYPFVGLDGNGNPTWGSSVPYAITPVLHNDDPVPNFPLLDNIVTQSGKLISFNAAAADNYTLHMDYHLGAIKLGNNNKWLWKTSRGTARYYGGEFPLYGDFDNGNTVNVGGNGAGGRICIHKDHVFWNYHGEFYKQGQTSKINHVDGNTGLFVGQFGTVGADYPNEFLFEQFAGNTYHICVVEVNGAAYLYLNNESGAMQRWTLHNLDSVQIAEATFPTSSTISDDFKVEGIDLMEGITWDMQQLPLSFNGWTKTSENLEGNGFVRAGLGSYTYDPFKHPDVAYWSVMTAPQNLIRTIPNTATLDSWSINSRINLVYNEASDGNSFAHGWYLAILDDNDKIITHFTSSFYGATTYYFNGETMFNLADYNPAERSRHSRHIRYLKPFNITCVNGTFYIEWGDYNFSTNTIYDNTANWHKPAKIQWQGWNNAGSEVSHFISIADLRFVDHAIAPVFPAKDTSKILLTDNFTTNGNLVGYNGWTSIAGTPNATITDGVVNLGTNAATYLFNNNVLSSLTNYEIEFKTVVVNNGSVVTFLFGYKDELNYCSLYMYRDGGNSVTGFASQFVNGIETPFYNPGSSSVSIKNYNAPFIDVKVHVSDTEFRVTFNEGTFVTKYFTTPLPSTSGKIGFKNIVSPILIKNLKISHL